MTQKEKVIMDWITAILAMSAILIFIYRLGSVRGYSEGFDDGFALAKYADKVDE